MHVGQMTDEQLRYLSLGFPMYKEPCFIPKAFLSTIMQQSKQQITELLNKKQSMLMQHKIILNCKQPIQNTAQLHI
jgi:hypothetical protein